MTTKPTIHYTYTDEAPALATHSFLPIIKAFTASTGIAVETADISLASRILAKFPERLSPEQRVEDTLARLGELALHPDTNIIKLPNISASVPQLKAAISELQARGFNLPDYPEEPANDAERGYKVSYDAVKGSAVNPVLREGNSDRRAPGAVKAFARNNPHSMGAWSSDSKSHVSTMDAGDFRSNEKSVHFDTADNLRIEHVSGDGTVTTLKDNLKIEANEILDGTFISKKALISFLKSEIVDARETGVLFSLHMKATMMKVSDPIIFGYGVETYFADLFDKHKDLFESLSVDPRNGFGDVISKIQSLPEAQRAEIEADIQAAYKAGPDLAMVNSDKGITNLHVPSDVIIDASMPAMIRTSGCMWNAEGKTQDTKAVIPDSSYAGLYQAVIDFCKQHGAFDPKTMGSVPNVGLMAKKAEEYGSHDKTFEVQSDGVIRIVDANGVTVMEHHVNAGDIWRACQVKDAPVRDWVKLAVTRAKATGVPAVFWLDEERPHDMQLILKVREYIKDHDTDGITWHIMSPVKATLFSLDRIKDGLDTISVTGNVLRDYLTDLFPILELGTSAKMLSIVPLMNGGGLFETGAGGSAPKHVQQFNNVNYLRWDSLGEFLALAVSLEHIATLSGNSQARIVGECLDKATTQYLLNNKSPARRLGKIDNRGSHFFLALYWAQALAAQDEDAALKARFSPIAETLAENETTIIDELIAVQNNPADVEGYYFPTPALADDFTRPSVTFNSIIDPLY